MAGYRINLDLFIPEKVFNKIPQQKKRAFASEIRALKSLAVKINEGQPNEEMTIKAVYHKCYHDEALPHLPCEPDVEI